ncbi:uncharacterized protein LOC114134038 isoform X3 [Xiphophorus couchianus]|uniref:uncharacterized protein LOC114134038 isoform X3 n=1 Tax=Xiphophorus couchianus TaxID=32473 RepID=UPI001015F34A|nr:uncharacterized protein LOC114134038 isoform X3 [Xiphophorus couchianus]
MLHTHVQQAESCACKCSGLRQAGSCRGRHMFRGRCRGDGERVQTLIALSGSCCEPEQQYGSLTGSSGPDSPVLVGITDRRLQCPALRSDWLPETRRLENVRVTERGRDAEQQQTHSWPGPIRKHAERAEPPLQVLQLQNIQIITVIILPLEMNKFLFVDKQNE